jgi:uncharacterized damage-inducible protein DinB
MSEQATALADRFEQANRELIAAIEGCSDAEWRLKTSAEQWSVGVVAHHVAEANKAVGGLIQMVANGQPLPPITMDAIHQRNAEHAAQHANTSKAETLDLLRRTAAAAAAVVRGLTDAQLARTAPLLGRPEPMSAQQMIEGILIAHVQGHLGSIRSTARR